ncbi:amidohydrolase family protein [Paraglaciecola hydrolytica]|uniref:Amidohydrolase-related domain-containing protein n=1 Tax=Paraglaciecola hydrolytica TaxID=1799789 RepID=A0A148KKC2_9ALTE|nr:amidohydrolase family protein [Paraglaciecola hydrolytica]KXI26746.1 hypothetical protein AX660_02925 [Paraglaciecola hydrolytica]
MKCQRSHQRYSLITIALLTLCCALPSQAKTESDASQYDLAIVNTSIISPERNEILANSVVLLRAGRIAAIVPKASKYNAANTLDGNGQYLLPGLIDSHVHLYHATGLKPRYTDHFDKLYAAYMQQMPRSYLYHGFTTIIETNADQETNDNFSKIDIRPDLAHCGAGLVLSDGYMASEIPEGQLLKYAPNFLYDHFRDAYLPEGVDPTEHSPHATVANIAASGAICVKLYYEEALWMPGGAPDIKLPSKEILTEVVTEAHALGLTVIMHATSPNGHQMAREIGVDVISHGPWDWLENNYNSATIPESINQSLFATANSKIDIQPTISSLQHTASLFKPDLLVRPELQHVLPAPFIDYLKSDAQIQREIFINIFGHAINDQPSSESVALSITQMIKRYKRMVGILAENGAHLLLGTDTSSGGFGWGNPPGLNGYWEILDWAESGVPLEVIFSAATIDNARAFGLQNEIGSVEVGKKANLLLSQANPLKNLDAYNKITTVILNGKVLPRETLSATSMR